jgi:parallel beta-helix repeat protein
VENCTITGNGNAGGIYVNDGADHWTFTNNTVSSNGRDGIRLSSVSYMTVNNNTCNSNAGYGIVFSSCGSGTTFYHGNTTTGNTSGTIYNDGTATAD